MATKQGTLKQIANEYYIVDAVGNRKTKFHPRPADAWDEFRKANGMSKIEKSKGKVA
jgi:hypothetical protein